MTRNDHGDAARIAAEAGRLLLALRDSGVSGPEADRRSHELIVSLLAMGHPSDGVLSEEGEEKDSSRLERHRVWVVDPLDGTREYAEPGRSDWAVHVALVVDGYPVAGAVCLPARGLTLCSRPPPPHPSPRQGLPPRILVSRTRPPEVATEVARRLGATVVPMGSAGAKTAAVVLGEAQVYLHGGGQYEWDSAAPVAVATAAGLHASRLDGSPLHYNRPDPWLPDLLVCRPELATAVLEAMGITS